MKFKNQLFVRVKFTMRLMKLITYTLIKFIYISVLDMYFNNGLYYLIYLGISSFNAQRSPSMKIFRSSFSSSISINKN